MTRRTTHDPAEALADYLFAPWTGGEAKEIIVKDFGGHHVHHWTKERLLDAIRKFYPPQKPKRKKR